MQIRKIGILSRTYRHANRYRQILTVLIKYGFGDLIDRLHVGEYIEIGLKLMSRSPKKQVERLTRAERIRMSLEELGPTFVKLGQVLSTRPDLVPLDLLEELSKLQDEVPSFPYQQVEETIAAELGGKISDYFREFDERPLAAASIGQVHRAVLYSGDEVIVKVQRPDVPATVDVDLEILLHLATLMERSIEEMAWYRPTRIVEEFARIIEREMDYTIEAANAQRFARFFLDNATVYIPHVYSEHSTQRVLVMERVRGIKISRIDELKERGYEPTVIAARGAELVLEQIFTHGFFHADPHPGNIFILPGNTICYLDFGMMGSIDRQSKDDFIDMLSAVIEHNEEKVVKVLLRILEWEKEPDRRLLETDVAGFMEISLYKPLKEIRFEQVLSSLLEIISRHRLRLPYDKFLMMKAMAAIEGLGLRLDPDFDMVAHATPYIKKLMRRRYDPRRIADELITTLSEHVQFMKILPGELQEIVKQLKEGRMRIGFEHRGLDRFISEMDRSSNRVSVALVISSLIIGSSLIIQSNIGPHLFGFSLLGIAGFMIAAIFGIWLIISIIRSGRL